MTKNSKVVWLVVIACVMILLVALLVRDFHLSGGITDCGDSQGPRPKIDLRRFETDYTGYSVSLEAELIGKGKFAGRIEPAALQKLSESIQTGREFRKALVAGYNACGLTRPAFQSAVLRFQTLDGLAREIEVLAGRPSLSEPERAALAMLVQRYSEITQKLGDPVK
jgi:hypothetical protein